MSDVRGTVGGPGHPIVKPIKLIALDDRGFADIGTVGNATIGG
jgi:hypothetical protein